MGKLKFCAIQGLAQDIKPQTLRLRIKHWQPYSMEIPFPFLFYRAMC